MYEIALTDDQLIKFQKIVKIRMVNESITYEQLAIKTGYSISTIYTFISSKKRNSRFVAAAIADCLKIKESEYR